MIILQGQIKKKTLAHQKKKTREKDPVIIPPG
jgi:hypothetical protein